jgi:hypothetical protein
MVNMHQGCGNRRDAGSLSKPPSAAPHRDAPNPKKLPNVMVKREAEEDWGRR